MKIILFSLLLLSARLFAQTNQTDAPQFSLISTNPMVFNYLWSTNKVCLMTNAEFRVTHGRRLVFKSGLDLESFDVDRIHPAILEALNLDPEKIHRDQAKLDADNQSFAQRQQALAQSMATNAAAVQAPAAAEAPATPATPPESNKPHTHRKKQQ